MFCMVTGDNSSEVSRHSAVFSWNGDNILDAEYVPVNVWGHILTFFLTHWDESQQNFWP